MFHKKLQVHIVEKLRKPQFKMKTAWIPQFMFMGFFMITMLAWFTQPVYAADIFSMAKDAMQKVYNDVVGIAAVPRCGEHGGLHVFVFDEFFKKRKNSG